MSGNHRSAPLFAGFWSSDSVSPESLGLWRAAVSAALIACTFYYYGAFLSLELGGPHFYLLGAPWYLELIGVVRLDPVHLQGVFWITLAALVVSLLGYRPRLFLLTALLGLIYLQGCRDGIAAAGKSRMVPFYFALLVLVLSRCGDAFSLQKTRRPLEARDLLWPVRLFQIVLVIFYSGAGINKLRFHGLDWPLHPPIQKSVILAFRGLELDSLSFLKELIESNDFLNPMLGILGLVLELAFVLVLLRKLWITLFLCAGMALFHVVNSFLLYPPFLFHPLLYLVFFDLAKLRKGKLELI